jgi:hypothetical protein
MRKLVYAGNILSSIPAALVVPLVPFIFILIQGEGRIPGHFHEYLLRGLMVLYPLALIGCLVSSIRLLRRNRPRPALWISFIPLAIFGLLLWTFLAGGVVLR